VIRGKAILAGVFALSAALAVGAPRAVAAPAPAPDPYQIFANSRAYWLLQRYPQRLEYDVAVDVVEGGAERVERYATDYDAVQDVVGVNPESDYQRTHPVYVSGMNLGILGMRLNKPLPPIDFLGVPHLAPTYSFGMAPFVPAPSPTPFNSAALVAEIRAEFHDPNPRASARPAPQSSTSLQEIATVVAHNRDYKIVLLGNDTIDGHPCYHLGLTPTRDPGRFRIRQAWIDQQTYAPWELQDALNFVDGPGTSVAWTIHFADVGGEHYIRDEDALAPMSVGGEIYTRASVRFENVHAVDLSTIREPIINNVGTVLQEPAPMIWPDTKEPN
jgi:hypothetical protein